MPTKSAFWIKTVGFKKKGQKVNEHKKAIFRQIGYVISIFSQNESGGPPPQSTPKNPLSGSKFRKKIFFHVYQAKKYLFWVSYFRGLKPFIKGLKWPLEFDFLNAFALDLNKNRLDRAPKSLFLKNSSSRRENILN